MDGRYVTTCNFLADTREEVVGGKTFLVAPVVALVEGVVNGKLATAAEIQASIPAWNGVPFTINHPERRGDAVMANTPEILAKQSIGRVFNAQFTGTKLRAEVWIDVVKAENLSDDSREILRRVREGEPLEVSTGWNSFLEQREGTHNGRQFDGVFRRILPDHLAALPDEQGACSWRDGCGMPRLNQAKGDDTSKMHAVWDAIKKVFVPIENAELSDNDIANAVRARLEDEGGASFDEFPWVVAVFGEEKEVVFEQGGKTFLRKFTVAESGEVSLAEGDAQEVQAKTTFIPVTNEQEEDAMDAQAKKARVDELIACPCTNLSEEDRPMLEGLDDAGLERQGVSEEALAAFVQSQTPAADTAPKAGEPDKGAEAPPADAPEGMVLITNEDKATLEGLRAEKEAQKTALIQVLVENRLCKFTAEQLETFEHAQLLTLHESIDRDDYSARGTFVPSEHSDDSGPPEDGSTLAGGSYKKEA